LPSILYMREKSPNYAKFMQFSENAGFY